MLWLVRSHRQRHFTIHSNVIGHDAQRTASEDVQITVRKKKWSARATGAPLLLSHISAFLAVAWGGGGGGGGGGRRKRGRVGWWGRQTGRQKHKRAGRERERETETERQRDRQTERGRKRQRQRETEKQRETETVTQRQRQTDRDLQAGKHAVNKSDNQADRNTFPLAHLSYHFKFLCPKLVQTF